LHVDPESICLPVVAIASGTALRAIAAKEESKQADSPSPPERSSDGASSNLNEQVHKRQLRPQKRESTVMDKLIAGVSAAYAQKRLSQGIEPDHEKPVRVGVGSWDAYVEATGDTRIRGGLEGEAKRTIAQFNLYAAEVTHPLSLEHSKAFEQMLQQHQQLERQQSSQFTRASHSPSQYQKLLKKRQTELD
jgi:hypothetical protein